MLVLARKLNETIRIGNDITLTIVKILPKAVIVRIDAPDGVLIAPAERLAKLKFDSRAPYKPRASAT